MIYATYFGQKINILVFFLRKTEKKPLIFLNIFFGTAGDTAGGSFWKIALFHKTTAGDTPAYRRRYLNPTLEICHPEKSKNPNFYKKYKF